MECFEVVGGVEFDFNASLCLSCIADDLWLFIGEFGFRGFRLGARVDDVEAHSRDLSIHFDPVGEEVATPFRDVDFDVPSSEFCAVIGPSCLEGGKGAFYFLPFDDEAGLPQLSFILLSMFRGKAHFFAGVGRDFTKGEVEEGGKEGVGLRAVDPPFVGKGEGLDEFAIIEVDLGGGPERVARSSTLKPRLPVCGGAGRGDRDLFHNEFVAVTAANK